MGWLPILMGRWLLPVRDIGRRWQWSTLGCLRGLAVRVICHSWQVWNVIGVLPERMHRAWSRMSLCALRLFIRTT